MTCAVSSSWLPFSASYGWAPMYSGEATPTQSGFEKLQQGYASSESDTRQVANSAGKKRPSRAGTRSVTSLSAAQLERKRANDREAQRAIRQRTKDHVDGLERSISDLRAAQETSDKMIAVTQQRNRHLEEENAYLRNKLGEAGYTVNISPAENQPSSDLSGLPVQARSPTSVRRSDSISTSRNVPSLNTSLSSDSRHGSWQQTPNSFATSAATGVPSISATNSVQLGPNLTTWRSHESSPSVHSSSGQLQDPSQTQPQTPYSPSNSNDRAQWAGTVPQPYPYQDQQRSQHFEPTPPAPQHQYCPPTMPAYAPGGTPQSAAYHAAPHPPQAEFQGMAVSSPTSYQIPQQPTFPQTGQYQMTPMQAPPAGNNPQYTPQPPPMQAAPYHPNPNDPAYGQHQVQPAIPFREDPSNRGFSLTHYPSG